MERLTAIYHFEEDEKLLQEMKTAYYKCQAAVKYIRSLGIPDELAEQEIVKIYDLVKDLNYCKNCPGFNNCGKDNPRFVTKIVYEDGVVSREIVTCKEYLRMVKFRSQYLVRDFPDEWLSSELEKIDRTKERKEVIAKYLSVMKGESNQWIYIMGEAGTGRTFVAANITLDIAKKEKGPIAFIDAPFRFKEITSKKDNDAFNELVERYQTVPVLVIDDLGNEYKNDLVRESVLFAILNARARAHLFTIITSDFDINDIATMYLTNKASEPKCEQIKRLLKRMCGKEINLGDLGVY